MKKTVTKQYRNRFRKVIAALSVLLLIGTLTITAFAAPPGGSSSSSSITWSGASTITSATAQTGQTYSSTTASQNALLVNTSGNVYLINPTVTKSGGTSAGDEESFYGINSAVMCKGGGTTTISGANITTSAAGANGVFSYGGNATTNATSGDGTTVVISDSTITTTGNGSGGIMTTGQGITQASNLTVNTSGASSAAIRSDRGGGTVTVDGGTYTTSGTGSPAIYATATITVNNATLTSTASQGVVNEGGNTVILNDCTLNASNASLGSQDYFRNGVFLYQSMSGDATDGASVFTMTGGTLNNTTGHVFHVTNTSAAITLEGVEINNTDAEGVLISVCDDAWSGLTNAATINAIDQTLEGTALVGSDSTLTISLPGSSVWTGHTSGSITSHRNSSAVSSSLGTVKLALSDSAVVVLDADCTVSSISGTGSINYNGHTLTVGSTSYTSGSPGVSTITETNSTGGETHTWDDGVITSAATCTTNGVITYTCTDCGITKTATISATGHTWNDGVVTTAATCTSTGVRTYTCTVCSETKTETISKTSHTDSDGDGYCDVCSIQIQSSSSSSGSSSSTSSSSSSSSSFFSFFQSIIEWFRNLFQKIFGIFSR